MKVKTALAIYLGGIFVIVTLAWLLAYFVAWWAGMALMCVVLADHVRYTVKEIFRRGNAS
jgi:hypothetical protein